MIATPLREADTTHGGAWLPHHSAGKMSGRAGDACADALTSGTVKPTSVTSVAASTVARFVIAQACRKDHDLTIPAWLLRNCGPALALSARATPLAFGVRAKPQAAGTRNVPACPGSAHMGGSCGSPPYTPVS